MHRVALTFDDGPHPRWTREILRVLAEARPVRATFFVWGEQAVEHADVVEEVLRAGHSVQPHCWRHRQHPDITATEIRRDTDRLLACLRALGAEGLHLWRPPWGQLRRRATRRIAWERGLDLVGWTADSHDWSGRSGREMYADVKQQISNLVGREAVVLMHDNCIEPFQAAHRAGCEGTAELVSRLIQDEELTFAPLTLGVAENLNEQPGRAVSFKLRSLWEQKV